MVSSERKYLYQGEVYTPSSAEVTILKMRKVLLQNVENVKMPEGPEVRTMYDFLVMFVGADVTETYGCTLALPTRISAVYVYGKHIYIHFSDHSQWHLTFGLTGTVRREFVAGTKVGLRTSKGDFFYVNVRYPIGKIEACDYRVKPDNYGPDILQYAIDYTTWCRAWTSRSMRRMLHVALLDQETVTGIGNYLKCEILYAARLAPTRVVSSLSNEEMYRLYTQSMLLIREAYQCKGLTISDYLTPFGERGSFVPRVYKQEVSPNARVVRYEKLGGRGTYWVPEEQM